MLGIRVNELIHGIKLQNIDFNNNKLLLTNTKGGKLLTRELTSESANLLKEVISKRYDSKGIQLFSIENGSVNKYLLRLERKINIKGQYSMHNIRARVAQDYYDHLRTKGYSKHDSLRETSLFLNHRNEREQMLTQSYLKIW